MGDKARYILVIVVLVVWLAFMARRFFDPTYPVPGEVGGLVTVVVGYALGSGVVRAARKEEPK